VNTTQVVLEYSADRRISVNKRDVTPAASRRFCRRSI
jgi:hypothetical protein